MVASASDDPCDPAPTDLLVVIAVIRGPQRAGGLGASWVGVPTKAGVGTIRSAVSRVHGLPPKMVLRLPLQRRLPARRRL